MEKKAQLDATIDSLRANPKQIIRLTDEESEPTKNNKK